MSEPDRPQFDSASVRQLFERAPRSVQLEPGDEFIVRETARRMLERSEAMRIATNSSPVRVLDAGCGSGADLAPLRARFPGAIVVGLDAAPSRLMRAQSTERAATNRLVRLLRRSAASPLVAADFAAPPFKQQSFDLIWSNLALHWSNSPHRVLPEWARAIKVGGLVMFSAFGPDTLAEVAAAFRNVDGSVHVMPFVDMHDYGDMLIDAGFTTPVVDMERLTLTYSDAASLWRDVQSLGGNPLTMRHRGLNGRGFGVRLANALDAGRDDQGRYRLTFELIFAHAWKGAPRTTADGSAIVKLHRRSAR